MIYRPEIAVSDERERAALTIYSTLLGGSMGSRLFEEIREKRGLCYSVYALDHAFADVPILQLGSGLESGKCVEAYTRMREIVDELRDEGPTEEEVHRARAYAAGRRVLAFENTNAVARYAANQKIVFGEDIDPDAAISALDAVTYDEVRAVAAGWRTTSPWPAWGRTRPRSSSRGRELRLCRPGAGAAAGARPGSGGSATQLGNFSIRRSSPSISPDPSARLLDIE